MWAKGMHSRTRTARSFCLGEMLGVCFRAEGAGESSLDSLTGIHCEKSAGEKKHSPGSRSTPE